MNTSLEELKREIYPILFGYYEDGETYKRAEKYADEKWTLIEECFSRHDTELAEKIGGMKNDVHPEITKWLTGTRETNEAQNAMFDKVLGLLTTTDKD